MKTYPYFKFLILFVFVAIAACSKKEDPIGTPDQNLSLVLKSSAGTEELEILSVNDSVYFTVTGSDGTDYSDIATYYVNDTPITQRAYFFTETGSFNVKAVFESTTSNILNFEVLALEERALTVDVSRAMKNQTITFGLFDGSGTNTASEATFYVNGTAISGFTFSSATEGSYEVYAEYVVNNETFTTPAKDFSVYIPKRNVVIEDYTGTWCGYCLDALVAIDHAKELTPYISVVAIHKTAISIPDPMDFAQIQDLQDEFNVPNSFPQTQLNRTEAWNDPYDFGAVTSIAGSETDVSVAINSQISGSNLSVDVKVVYANGSEPGDKVVVYLIESGVIAPQANYFNNVQGHPYQGYGNPIPNFVHNDALRNSLSNLFGDNIPETTAYEVYSKNYIFTVPAEYNKDNLSFVIMVVKADNSAKNSQHAVLGENKIFQ